VFVCPGVQRRAENVRPSSARTGNMSDEPLGYCTRAVVRPIEGSAARFGQGCCRIPEFPNRTSTSRVAVDAQFGLRRSLSVLEGGFADAPPLGQRFELAGATLSLTSGSRSSTRRRKRVRWRDLRLLTSDGVRTP